MLKYCIVVSFYDTLVDKSNYICYRSRTILNYYKKNETHDRKIAYTIQVKVHYYEEDLTIVQSE